MSNLSIYFSVGLASLHLTVKFCGQEPLHMPFCALPHRWGSPILYAAPLQVSVLSYMVNKQRSQCTIVV